MGLPISYNLRNLWERRVTTLMTALGIALTVSVLVATVAMLSGLNALFNQSGNPRQLVVLRQGSDSELISTVTEESYQTIRAMPGIARAPGGEPMVAPEGMTVVNLPSVDAPDGINITVRGVLPISLQMRPTKIVQGRMFTPGRREIVIGSSVARRYPVAAVGRQLRFGRGLWDVVGVFEAESRANNSEVWADLNQLRGDFEREGGSNSLLVRLESVENVEPLARRIKDDQRLNSNALTETAYYARQTEGGNFLASLGFSVAVIMAVGSTFAATNTMYAAVARRSREIGVLRAIGFNRAQILRSFVTESVALSLVGGVLGVLIALPVNGLATGIGTANFSEVSFSFRVGPGPVLAGLGFSVFIGLVGGLLPAWQAARKNVIQAMRDG